jgi:transposase
MNGDENWRPSAKEIVTAEQLLANTTRFETRLKIVRALKDRRDAPLKVVAGTAKTRTIVVTAFLCRWRAHGVESVVESGRPRDLNASQLNHLRKQLTSGRLKSLDQVRTNIETKFGLKFDLRSVRAYCRRLGFNLPANSERPKLRLHNSWCDTNVAKCSGDNQRLHRRLTAIIRACNEPAVSLRKIAEPDGKYFVPESTLRADLKAITSNTTLEQFVKRNRRIPLLERLNLKQALHDWADEQHKVKGKAPSVDQVVEFLRTPHGVPINAKAAYNYLAEWKRKAKIGTRRYRRREKIVPSEGVAAWSPR